MKQPDLAKTASISIRRLRAFEAGTIRPSPEELSSIVDALGMRLSELFAKSPEEDDQVDSC